MNISCKALTEQGKKVLSQVITDNKEELTHMDIKKRQGFYKTWKEITTPTQYTLLLRMCSGLGATYMITKRFTAGVDSAKAFHKDINKEFDNIVNEIDTAMQKTGAQKDIDYIIEVQK